LTVPEAWIIERDGSEVNGTRSVRVLHVLLLVSTLLFFSCADDEERALKMYDMAMEQIESGEIENAVAAFNEVVDKYPRTRVASRARDAILLYQGLAEAVRSYPVRTAREMMVQTGRALERYRARHRSWPESLDRLMPDYIHEPPVDSWGRVMLYERIRKGRGYVLACYGSDGEPGGDGEATDWFVESGSFVRSPSVRPQ